MNLWPTPGTSPRRRDLLQRWSLAMLAVPASAQALPARSLVFPRDFGAHPELRTEWWYITGHAQAEGGRELGFQLTFFRSRVDAAQALRSRFAAKQLVFAHAAVTDLQGRTLLHDQRIARAGFGLAEAATDDTQLRLDGWTLTRSGQVQSSRYQARLAARDFSLDLDFDARSLVLQGVQGLSRKGPSERQASYYYSRPQLKAQGHIALRGQRLAVQGRAWLDHEWSESLLHPQAQGWDWIGMNLDDGSALTAFRLRRADGTALWDGGSWHSASGITRNFPNGSVHFSPVRHWTSPLTGALYPVEWQVDTPAGPWRVRARLDAQELDSRQSTGAVYWEGLSELIHAQGHRCGQGYLEMTGYAAPLRLG